jgi:arsenate reductase-like glutaredoxin family protein
MEPLSSKKLLDEEQIAIIFSNMEQIKAANETLLAGMEDGTMTMGQLFKRMGPFFKIYSEYVKNFDQSSALLDELALKNKKIARFLETTSDNQDVGMALASFLILPVQSSYD